MQDTKPRLAAQFLPLRSKHYGATRDITESLKLPEMSALLDRHTRGDWGDVCDEDAALNDAALLDGSRILSAYTVRGQKIWVITDAADDDGEREATTILTPEEY